VAVEAIASRILVLRGLRVLLDADLAALYGVPIKRFNEAVKRNSAKFPDEFVFRLSDQEFAALRSQSATSNAGPVPFEPAVSGARDASKQTGRVHHRLSD
jgi:hypothetical protein